MKIPVQQVPFVRHDVFIADECFLTGSAAEVIPVVKLDSRIIAIKVPKIRPPSAESAVSVTVNVIPSINRYPRDRRMTSKSKLLNMGAISR